MSVPCPIPDFCWGFVFPTGCRYYTSVHVLLSLCYLLYEGFYFVSILVSVLVLTNVIVQSSL
jgi:hypothetical protein